MGVGTRSASHLLQRYSTKMDEFLESEGLTKPESIVQQLKGQGIHSYFDMHLAHIQRQHEVCGVTLPYCHGINMTPPCLPSSYRWKSRLPLPR